MTEPKTNHGRTRSGTAIMDDLIGRWAREAEAGYEPQRLRPRGRPRMGSAPATTTPVRLDPDLRAAVEQRAERDGTTISDVIRAALRHHLDEAS
jgi:hypothetical protein